MTLTGLSLVFSIASLTHLCPQLLDIDDELAQSVASVKTVATQAFQLWLNKPLEELGWQYTPG